MLVKLSVREAIAVKFGLRELVSTAVLAALAVAIQAMNLPQPVTGPAVNAVLYVGALFVGPLSGAVVGLLTPWVALLMGILKLAPAIPVVMTGNVSLVLCAALIARWNRHAGMLLAAFVKFGVMTLGIRYLVSAGAKIPPVAVASLTTTQLFTALGGAVVAALVLEALGRMRHGRPSS